MNRLLLSFKELVVASEAEIHKEDFCHGFHLICHLPFIRPRKTVAVFVVETDGFLFCVSVRFPRRGLPETRSKWGKKGANSRMSWPEGERRLTPIVGQKLHMDNIYQK